MQEELRLTIRNDLGELARVNELASEMLARRRVEPRVLYAVQLALEEVLSNVIRHGFEDDGPHEIALQLRIDESGVELVVEDDGRAFDPTTAPEPNPRVPLAEWREGGLGIHLLRAYAREIRYERIGRRNRLWLRI